MALRLPFRWDVRTLRTPINMSLTTDAGRIDLLTVVDGLGDYAAVRAGATMVVLNGYPVAVLDLPDLLRAKRAAGRPKDLLVLGELEAMQHLRDQAQEEPGGEP